MGDDGMASRHISGSGPCKCLCGHKNHACLWHLNSWIVCERRGFDAEVLTTLVWMVVHASDAPQARRMQPVLRRPELGLVCSLLLVAALCTPLMTNRHDMGLRCDICS